MYRRRPHYLYPRKRYYSRTKSRLKPLLPPLDPETKKGIIIVIIFALAFISLLSLFDLAGDLGKIINQLLKTFFGWADWLFAICLIIFGYLLLNQEKLKINARNIFGLFLLFLIFTGIFQTVLNFNEDVKLIENQGGGYLGFALVFPLKQIMGWWATVIILIALFFISLLLTFNTSIKNLILFLPKFWQKIKNLLLTKKIKEITEVASPTISKKEESSLVGFTNKKLGPGPETEEKESFTLEEDISIIKSKKHYAKIDIPLDLLDGHSTKPTSGDIKSNMEKIKATLEHFGLIVEMNEVNVGPTVTQYTLKPAEGLKLSKIVALQNDLALTLAAHPIRIEAPIPGKSLVGIEVPNQIVAVVKLKEILESPIFQKRRGNLYFALGKDVAGQAWIADLESMPHLLIAGATGSGKSVCINSLIISLLYQNSSENLKLILIDPKRVEMTNYNDIPHLLTPVITEVDKTINALRWVINEMDERYKFLSRHNKRNITVYNQSVLFNKLPYIIIVIDELADLMAVAPREVEGAIIRLSQIARAVGIHLVMATQRPSVNVITGLIKANITSRIAFAVASQVDSRTILDLAGAEKLLGKGDMLFISSQLSKPKRLQGAYVSDQEIERITGYLKAKAQPDYQTEVTERQTKTIGISFDEVTYDDDLLEEAKEVILKANKASASLLQRRLRVGYARAARLLDLLEEQGIIGPADGAKPREILVTREDLASDYLAESIPEAEEELTGEEEEKEPLEEQSDDELSNGEEKYNS